MSASSYRKNQHSAYPRSTFDKVSLNLVSMTIGSHTLPALCHKITIMNKDEYKKHIGDKYSGSEY